MLCHCDSKPVRKYTNALIDQFVCAFTDASRRGLPLKYGETIRCNAVREPAFLKWKIKPADPLTGAILSLELEPECSGTNLY